MAGEGGVTGGCPKAGAARGTEKMELGFVVDVLAGGGVDGLPKMLVVNAGMGGLVSRASAGDGGFPAPANGMEKIPLGFGGPAIVAKRGGVFGRLVASRPNLAEVSVGGFDGVLAVSSSSELSSSPEMGALAANGELRVGRVDGRPIPRPVGVLVGLGDTIGIEGDDSDLTGELDGVVV